MTLYIKRPVILKNIVTENFKEKLIGEINNMIKQVETRIEQMEFQGKRMLADLGKKDPKKTSGLRSEINNERAKQGQLREGLESKLAEVERLQIDDVYVSGVYDSPVKIEVGDNVMEKLSQAEITVKDGVVVQIIE